MPKTEIDYSNTIIYKISCNDESVKDLYVGHTTNFVQRKHAHKQGCINMKSANYKCKLYQKIRENGGWNNWTMEIVNFFNCKDHYEARIKEQEYFILLNATLNAVEPFPKPKEIVKIAKQIIEDKTKNNNITVTPEELPKIPYKFLCEICNYKSNKQSEFNKHILTNKHKTLQKSTYIQNNNKTYICECGSKYKHASSLWNHKKKCETIINKNTNNTQIISTNNEDTYKELVISILKQNTEIMKEHSELKTMIMQVLKFMSDKNIQVPDKEY